MCAPAPCADTSCACEPCLQLNSRRAAAVCKVAGIDVSLCCRTGSDQFLAQCAKQQDMLRATVLLAGVIKPEQ
jgi:hypothetical protein